MSVICVLQRVGSASASVSGEVVASIGPGFLALVGVARSDTTADACAVASKIAGLRVFGDENGLMNRAVSEIGGEVLVVSQFTLLAELRKGRRPSFVAAAPPEPAARLIDEVRRELTTHGVPVSSGVFGAHMSVELVNDGPVTLIVQTASGRVL